MRYLNKNIDLRFLVSISLWFQQKGGGLKKIRGQLYSERRALHVPNTNLNLSDSAERVWVYRVNIRIFM